MLWTVVLEKTLGSPLDCKEIKPVNPKGNQSWIFFGRTDAEAEAPILLATCCEELTHWKRSWCWGSLRAGGEGDDRGQDGLMVSLTQWTWVWASFRRWWRTGKPGVLQSMGLQRVRCNWTTEQQHFRFHCVFIALHRLFSSCNEQGLLSVKPSLVLSRLSSADSSHLVLPRLPTSVSSFIRLCLDFSSPLWNLDMLTEVSWE